METDELRPRYPTSDAQQLRETTEGGIDFDIWFLRPRLRVYESLGVFGEFYLRERSPNERPKLANEHKNELYEHN